MLLYFLCGYSQSCAFISVIELPRIPAYFPKILHRFYASSGGVIPNFVCMPEFIASENSLVYKKYILPIILSNMSFQCFQSTEPWQARIIQIMIKIMETQENEKIRELSTLALLQNLWLIFYENVKLSDKEKMQTVDDAIYT